MIKYIVNFNYLQFVDFLQQGFNTSLLFFTPQGSDVGVIRHRLLLSGQDIVLLYGVTDSTEKSPYY